MTASRTLTAYLPEAELARAKSGKFHFFTCLKFALASVGWQAIFRPDTDENIFRSASLPGLSLFYMRPVTHERALCLRKAYFYPFWRIEKSDKRWEFDVARRSFDADLIDKAKATKWAHEARNWMHGSGDVESSDGDHILVALQGRLTRQRSFQNASPIDMLTLAAEHFSNRDVVATLHPGETYSDEDMEALRLTLNTHKNLQIKPSTDDDLLASAKLVVTENSSIALKGFFWSKPAVCFAKSDFHHIAQNAFFDTASASFDKALQSPRPYAEFLYWFFQENAINAGREDVTDQIFATLQARGWDLKAPA